MAATVTLEILSGPIKGRKFSFDAHDTFLFGRCKDCHARLPHDSLISRHHFLLEVNPPDVRIRDLGSRNGTYVNGVKNGGRAVHESREEIAGREYRHVNLSDGDQIKAGTTMIEVRIKLPPICERCGVALPESVEASRGRSRICDRCMQSKSEAFPTVLELFCQSCGKNVSGEAGLRCGGDYVCRECQAAALAEQGGLRRLMQQALMKQHQSVTLSIEGYEIGEELGRGGMGVVYRSVRKSDGRPMAVKIMLAKIAVEEQKRQLFLREIDVARRLSHPNIVKLIERGSVGSAFYFVMEHCSGGSLDQWVKTHADRVSVPILTRLLMACLSGLEFAHRASYVHRDLKPQNILMDQQDGKWKPRIADFGLAKNFESAGMSGMTISGSFGGTFAFMPREQITEFRYARPVSDLWSMAATFYNLITGHYPLDFPATSDPMRIILNDEPIPIRERDSTIPAQIAVALDRALLTDISLRFQSASEMRQALASALTR
ncbi:MAG TPA: protein kinase [Pirellulales bacterium]